MGGCKLIKEELLKEKIGKAGINYFEIDDSFIKSLVDEHTLFLADDNLDDLIRFAICNQIRTIFYFYVYNDENYFLINEYDIAKFDKEILELMEPYIIEHNTKVSQLDFDRPTGVYMFCLYEGHYVVVGEHDDWIQDLGILSSEEIIAELRTIFAEEIEEIYQEQIQREQQEYEARVQEQIKATEDLRIEFKNYLLNNDEFKICTNKKMRDDFIYLLLQKEENQRFKKIFTRDNFFHIAHTRGFVDMVWKEYKESCKKC